MNSKVDGFFERSGRWQAEFTLLRERVLSRGLEESPAWGKPCDTLEGKNVVFLHGFKAYCALLFCKGALLKDDETILVHQTTNVQAARQARFTSVADIGWLRAVLKACGAGAIAPEPSGRQAEKKKDASV